VNDVKTPLRKRKEAWRRHREVQGTLPIVSSDSESDPSACPYTTPLAPISDPRPLAYRAVLANWPDEWRERWGRRANALEETGLHWRDAEGQAFVDVWNQRRAAEEAERN
jgi:hypothetical protein